MGDTAADFKLAMLTSLAQVDRPCIEEDITPQDLELEIGHLCIPEECKTKKTDIALTVVTPTNDVIAEGTIRGRASEIIKAATNKAKTKTLFAAYIKELVR